MTNINDIDKINLNGSHKDELVTNNHPNLSISMDTNKSKGKIGEKTKLSVINGVFDATLIITLMKDLVPLLSQKDTIDEFWQLKIVIITILLFLQFGVMVLLSLLTIVKDKNKLEKINNIVLAISSLMFLIELIRGKFYVETKSELKLEN
jgi:hypothetical protein